MLAVQVDEAARLRLTTVDEPRPCHGELLVGVRAISINRGEVIRARVAGEGFRPGWDFAGIVQRSAAGGPAEGTRVAGYLRSGAWAERIAVPPASVAIVPDAVTLEAAATLPVAGLTALGALDLAGGLLGRRVLVTGASGGVGSFASNLATLAGAEVTAVVRRPASQCRPLLPGVAQILTIDEGLAGAARYGPFDLVVETLGGAALGEALSMLSPTGKCVTVGVTDAAETWFDAERFFMTGSACLQGFVLFRNRSGETPGEGLGRLLRLAANGGLLASVGLQAAWTDIEDVAARLLTRSFLGKAALRVETGHG